MTLCIRGIRNFLTSSQRQDYDEGKYDDNAWRDKFNREKRSFNNSTEKTDIQRKKRSVFGANPPAQLVFLAFPHTYPGMC